MSLFSDTQHGTTDTSEDEEEEDMGEVTDLKYFSLPVQELLHMIAVGFLVILEFLT